MYDFPTNPPFGTVVNVPDGSYRVWDNRKWTAAPSANVVLPGQGYLPLTGGNINGNLSISGTTALNILNVTGPATLNILNVTGPATLNILNVTGPATFTKNLTINYAGAYSGEPASLTNTALNIVENISGFTSGHDWVSLIPITINDTLTVNAPDRVIATFQGQINASTLALNSTVMPPTPFVTFNGTISGATLTQSSVMNGPLAVGMTVQWPGGTDMIKAPAGPNMWTLYNSWGTIATQPMTGIVAFSVMASISGSLLTVNTAYGPGVITAGMQVQWQLPTPGTTTITTGPAGGPYHLFNDFTASGPIPLQPMILMGPQPAQTISWDTGDPDNPGKATVGSYITGHPAQFSVVSDWDLVSSIPMQVVKSGTIQQTIGVYLKHNYGAADGGRIGFRVDLQQTSAMSRQGNRLPVLFGNGVHYPSGGTDVWSGALGTHWGGNSVMTFVKNAGTPVGSPGPINYRGGASWEFDYQCVAGSTDDPAYPKATTAILGGIAVIRGGQSTWEAPMWESDYAVVISQQGPVLRDLSNNPVRPKAAKYGLRFGSTGGLPAIDPLHGRAIAAVYGIGAWNTDGTPGLYANQAPFGVDWIMFDYTRAPYRWQGGAVLGSATPLPGALAIGGGYLSATNTTVSLDTAGSVCTGATVAPGFGGANCYLGMVCIDDNTGTQVVVTGVDGAVSPRIGAATTVVLIPRTGQSHNAEIPTNPVPFRPMGNPLTFLAPGPTGPKLNLTWTAPTTLALQPSGGATVFGGPVTLPAGSTGAFLPLTGGNLTGAVKFGAVPWTIGHTDSGGVKFRITQGPSPGTNDQMVFDGSGNIGIGTANPTGKFQIINLASARTTFQVNQTGPTSGSFAGPIFLNDFNTSFAAAVTGAGINAQVSGFHASLGVGGPNLAGVEFYGGAFGLVHTSSDTATGDKVGVSAGVSSNFSSPGKIYGASFSHGIGSGGSTPQAIGVEVDSIITGTGSAVARIGFNAWQGGTNPGTSFDAAYAVSNSGAAGTDVGAWQNLIGLYSAGGTLQRALAPTANFFFSDVAITVGSIFNLPNVTVTNNILNFPHATLTGAGTLTLGTGFVATNGQVTVGSNAFAGPSIFINGAAGAGRPIRWQTAGVARWQFTTNSTAEGGSNAGSDLDITHYDDGGSLIGTVAMRIIRATGNVLINTGTDSGYKLDVVGNTRLNGLVGFQGSAPIAKPTVSGACAGNTAIKALLTALVSYGLVIDGTTV